MVIFLLNLGLLREDERVCQEPRFIGWWNGHWCVLYDYFRNGFIVRTLHDD